MAKGLDLMELEAQTGGLLPERIEMRRRHWKRRMYNHFEQRFGGNGGNFCSVGPNNTGVVNQCNGGPA